MIYLDNAATTLKKPAGVAEAVARAMNSLGNSARGTHESSLSAAHTVYEARVKIAKFFGCPRPDHVVFCSNVTEALNIALFGLLKKGDHVITTALEHNSVLRPLYALEDEGRIELSMVEADEKGRPKYGQFESLFRENTKAIVCTHASNLTGNVADLAHVGALAKKRGAFLIVDAAQTAGNRRIDMAELGIDVLCFTGHKSLMGPQGTGGLCLAEGFEGELTPFKRGGTGVQSYSRTQPRELPTLLEAGTLNAHGIAGLSAAIDFINETGIEKIRARDEELTKLFLAGVSDIPGIRLYGDFSAEHCAIVALNIGDIESGLVSDALSERYGIATRPGAHCAPRMHEALGTAEQGAVRFSFSYFTTEAEVEAAAAALRELARPD